MKVHLKPTGLYSTAMVRIANALTKYRPDNVEIIDSRLKADLAILYVIGPDSPPYAAELLSNGVNYAAVQCCLVTAGYNQSQESQDVWNEFWGNAQLVWSYYDIPSAPYFYYAPLGIDSVFKPDQAKLSDNREKLIVTSGFVSGNPAEPIEEVWIAAREAGYKVVHISTGNVQGINDRSLLHYVDLVGKLTDIELASLYSRASHVAALRYVEGFELPAAEGLACGSRPICFDQPAMRHWYGDSVLYVNDGASGRQLIDELVETLSYHLPSVAKVLEDERQNVIDRFDWKDICEGFWSRFQ